MLTKPLLRLKGSHTVLIITLGFVSSILIRALYESWMDTATHNLLVFEVLYGIFNTFPPAMLGSFLGLYIQHKIFGDEDE